MIIKSDKDIIQNYFEDTSNIRGGHADEVVIPESSSELASFMKEANAGRTPVTVSGGGTGTTGSRIPFGGAVVSMERLNRTIDVSAAKMSATVEAGVLVEELKDSAEGRGLFYTSHPTEKTAFIGGTIATNASGARSFKYGPTRKYVKRLKMVMADGEEFELSRGQIFLSKDKHEIKLPSGRVIDIPVPRYRMPNIKSSAGYFWKDCMDAIDLFVGQEGTLSVITEAELGLVTKPSGILSSFVFFKEEEDAISFTEEVKKENALDVLSIEYFDRGAVDTLRGRNKNVPAAALAAIFFEQDVTRKDPDAVMDLWGELISRHNSSLDDTWVAMSEKDSGVFLDLRHSIPDAINDRIKRSGFKKFSTDIAVPGNKFLEMVFYYRQAFNETGLSHTIFGHIGENHLHVNILPGSQKEAEAAKKLSLEFAKKAVSLGGTIAAEHGIGKLKHEYLEVMYGREGMMDMARIKKAFDPNCILGLDNIFPKELLA
ncbi:MAG: FAD-binding oxidoreductase [Candidatus Omnitrophica bacterium]|nr:FAD-binding oxidoreductase [Candidatus Omnitrophota bacterium]MDD5437264.1 FAD-binding oxidoreductase [Candidatus Omnitrophota bacterium]